MRVLGWTGLGVSEKNDDGEAVELVITGLADNGVHNLNVILTEPG